MVAAAAAAATGTVVVAVEVVAVVVGTAVVAAEAAAVVALAAAVALPVFEVLWVLWTGGAVASSWAYPHGPMQPTQHSTKVTNKSINMGHNSNAINAQVSTSYRTDKQIREKKYGMISVLRAYPRTTTCSARSEQRK